MLKSIQQLFRKRADEATAGFKEHVLKIRSKTPPLKIELVAAADASWLEVPAAQQIVQQLARTGFQPAGVLAVKGNEKAVVAGFAAVEHRVYATIPKGGDPFFVSFISHFTDGTAFESSNQPVPMELPCPEWLVRRRHVGVSMQELWSAFLSERPAKDLAESTVAGFATSNTDDFFRYQAWMAERGGMTREELALRFKAIGKLPVGQEGESLLKMARNDEVERSLCNWWRLQKDAPSPLEAVLESLIIIHDEMSRDVVVNAYWCATYDFGVKEADFAEGSPREAFARVLSSRGSKLRRVHQKCTPLEADFYLPG